MLTELQDMKNEILEDLWWEKEDVRCDLILDHLADAVFVIDEGCSEEKIKAILYEATEEAFNAFKEFYSDKADEMTIEKDKEFKDNYNIES